MLLTLLRPHFLELCDLFLLFCELLPFVFFLFATLGLTFSSLFDSTPVESSFSSSSSPKSNNSRLSSSSLSSTGIFRRFWLVDFDLPGFGGLATLRGVRRGLGLGSSRSLSSTVFFCRFLAAGVRPFWARFVLPEEKKPLLHNAFYSEKCPGKVLFFNSSFVAILQSNKLSAYQSRHTGQYRNRHRRCKVCVKQFISTDWPVQLPYVIIPGIAPKYSNFIPN